MLICEETDGFAMFEDTVIGRLVGGRFSGVRLGVLDVDGGSYEDVSTGGLLKDRGGSVVGRDGGTVGTGGEDGGTSGVEMDAGGGISVVGGIGARGSLITVTGWGFWDVGGPGGGTGEGEGLSFVLGGGGGGLDALSLGGGFVGWGVGEESIFQGVNRYFEVGAEGRKPEALVNGARRESI